jgi:multiple sugar transport system substrate-binding protein
MKRYVFLTAAIGVAVSIAVAGAAQAAPKPSGTIVLSGWASSPAETALLKNLIASFEAANPTIHIDYRPIDGNYAAEMEAKFRAGTPPDVFYVDSSNARFWIEQGWLKPLNNYIRESSFDTTPFFRPLIDAFTGPGDRVYGLPKDWSPLALYANDDMLAAAGVTPPTTWAALRAAAARLFVPGGAPICLSALWERVLPFVYQNGGSFLSDDQRTVTVDSSEVAGALGFLLQLQRDGLLATPEQLGEPWCGQALADGRAAMTFEGNWLAPFLDDFFPGLHYSIDPMVRNTQAGNIAFTVSYSIASASEKKRAAWEFIRYATGPVGMAVWTAGGLALPSRDDVAPAPGREAFLADADAARVWQFPPALDSVIPFADSELGAVFAGTKTIDAILAEVAAAAKAAIASARDD